MDRVQMEEITSELTECHFVVLSFSDLPVSLFIILDFS